MRFFPPLKKKIMLKIQKYCPPRTFLSELQGQTLREKVCRLDRWGARRATPHPIVGCGDCRSKSRGSHGGWRWPGIRTGLTLSAPDAQSISAHPGIRERGWRESLCESSRISLGNCQQDLQQPTSVTSWWTESFRKDMWKVNEAQGNS